MDGKPLRVDRDEIGAAEVLPTAEACQALARHAERVRTAAGRFSAAPVPAGSLPAELTDQDVSAGQARRQARHLRSARFLATVVAHADYRDLPGFESPKRLMLDTLSALNLARGAGNLLRRQGIQTLVGSRAEVELVRRCMGSLWPPGVDLYDILRETYPAFHARLTGQVPACLTGDLAALVAQPVAARQVGGVGRFTIDPAGRFLGLYPVVSVPAAGVGAEAPLFSQDQLGRREIVARVLADAVQVVTTGAGRCLVVDYAGGVGNLSELLLRAIEDVSDDTLRNRLRGRVRLVVVDAAEGQLAAGRERIRRLSERLGQPDLEHRIRFVAADVTRPLGPLFAAGTGPDGAAWPADPVEIGMTSYTTGALDNAQSAAGLPVSTAMADAMAARSWRIYAVDFSSPAWREADFLADTGPWGQAYLRAVHGRTDAIDERVPVAAWLRALVRLRCGTRLKTRGDFVRFMALAPGLAAHYQTVWPGADGHSAGYSVQPDGRLRKPAIVSFAERLGVRGARVGYRSQVRLFATLDLGRMAGGRRAWALVPGWVSDLVLAEQPARAPAAEAV